LVPLVLTGYFLSNRSARELRSAENRYQIQLVQEKASQIEMFAQRYDSMIDGLSIAISQSKNPAVLASAETESQMATYLRENPDLIAISIKPAVGDTLSVFRPGINTADVERMATQATTEKKGDNVWVGTPKRVSNNGTQAITFSKEVRVNGQHAADIVALASTQAISQSIVGINTMTNAELWHAGYPMVFVVDQNGKAVFHPDQQLARSSRPMNDLKIVSEWLEGGSQVQSALVPFTAAFEERSHEMIGAYSTARLGPQQSFGVITMQDEAKALAGVGEMRTQTWFISMAFAVFALGIGLVLSRYMTAPLLRLVAAAKRISEGDFSNRVDTRNMTEVGTLGETFNVMSEKIEDQIANLACAAAENRELFVGTVKALAAAIDGKDKYTRGHSERVSRISVAIGKRMGLDDKELETLRMSALLHDVGKIAIDDAILKKPAALTDAEFEIMKTHPQRGYKIMSQIPAMKDFLPGMYMHHEMVNGKGYPQGLKGDEIPLQAKIVSVADTFDAMTIDRPYQKGMELKAALERIGSFVGTRYEGSVVDALYLACEDGEIANGIVRQMAAIRAAEAAQTEKAAEEVEESDILSLVA